MEKVEKGNTIKVHYTGTLNDGTVFDTSKDRDPIEFTVGSGNMIPGFDAAVIDMKMNEKKTVDIPYKDAYGERRDDLLLSIERNNIPDDANIEVGQMLQMKSPEGEVYNVIIAEITDDSITLDANHPMAGLDLKFDLELVEIVSK